MDGVCECLDGKWNGWNCECPGDLEWTYFNNGSLGGECGCISGKKVEDRCLCGGDLESLDVGNKQICGCSA